MWIASLIAMIEGDPAALPNGYVLPYEHRRRLRLALRKWLPSSSGAERARRRRARAPDVCRRLRALAIERDRNVCGICLDFCTTEEAHIDHVIPVARGGRTVLENLQMAHPRCNREKGAS